MGGSVGKLSKETGFSKAKIKGMQKLREGRKVKLTSASLVLKFGLDEELAYLLTKALDRDGNGEIEFSELVSALYILGDEADLDEKIDFCFQLYDRNGDGYLTPQEYTEATETLISNMKKLTNSFHKFLLETNSTVELVRFTEDEDGDQQCEEVSPQQLQEEITRDFIKHAKTNEKGKINIEEFKAYAREHPETLMGLVRLQVVVSSLMSRCEKARRHRKQQRAYDRW
ncbi:Calcium-binding protein NCS-1 [Balamuthia mandrillaris]